MKLQTWFFIILSLTLCFVVYDVTNFFTTNDSMVLTHWTGRVKECNIDEVQRNVQLHKQYSRYKINDVDILPQNYFGFNITLIFVLYYDMDLVEDILRLSKPFISDIVVVDGPRKPTMKMLSALDLLYNENTSIVKHFFLVKMKQKFPELNIKYIFNEWEDEEVQRQAGFNLCTTDLQIIADGDTLVRFDPIAIHNFIATGRREFDYWGNEVNCIRRGVARYEVLNLISLDIFFSAQNNTKAKSYQPVAANHRVVNFTEFFDHLWIVGGRQNEPDKSLIFKTPIGVALHFTLARSLTTMMVKYAFYLTVPGNYEHFVVKHNLIELLRNISNRFGLETAREVFIHSTMPSATCMSNDFLLSTNQGKALAIKEAFPPDVVPMWREEFPGFTVPREYFCNYTFLSGGIYHNKSLSRDMGISFTKRRIWFAHQILSYISLNEKQSMKNRICFKFSNNCDNCDVDILLFQLSHKMSTVVTQRNIISPNNSSTNAMVNLSFPGKEDINKSQFVRMVLVLNCRLNPVNGTSLVGWYEETECFD